jgi:cytochrome b subunit of formate dehydrogenase
VKWFLWLGPKPRWDKYTYYEKFDYWAVFWGVAIIGTTGLCMWFKEFFTGVLRLPGWIINVAMEVHSHEALLAAGFIFSIHFFNGHLRPGRFPMDRVIFLGSINRHELEEERPELYQRLVENGELEKIKAASPPTWLRVLGTLFGIAALITGIVIVVWIFRMELGHIFH